MLVALCTASVAFTAAATPPIDIVSTGDLHFGAFAANTGGTVTVSPSGVVTAGGGVVVPLSSSGQAATFSVTGEPDFVFAITLPLDGIEALHGSGSDMPLSDFTCSSGAFGQLNGAGSLNVAVGATLTVGSAQQPGSYSGSFSLIVEYN